MLTGSLVSSLQGEPRATHDIDVIVSLRAEDLNGVMQAFPPPRFDRRVREQVLGTATWVSSPEDTILAKLRWAMKSGGSEKQFGDALRVYEVQHPGLDLAYLELWQEKLGVSELWRRLLSEAVVI